MALKLADLYAAVFLSADYDGGRVGIDLDDTADLPLSILVDAPPPFLTDFSAADADYFYIRFRYVQVGMPGENDGGVTITQTELMRCIGVVGASGNTQARLTVVRGVGLIGDVNPRRNWIRPTTVARAGDASPAPGVYAVISLVATAEDLSGIGGEIGRNLVPASLYGDDAVHIKIGDEGGGSPRANGPVIGTAANPFAQVATQSLLLSDNGNLRGVKLSHSPSAADGEEDFPIILFPRRGGVIALSEDIAEQNLSVMGNFNARFWNAGDDYPLAGGDSGDVVHVLQRQNNPGKTLLLTNKSSAFAVLFLAAASGSGTLGTGAIVDGATREAYIYNGLTGDARTQISVRFSNSPSNMWTAEFDTTASHISDMILREVLSRVRVNFGTTGSVISAYHGGFNSIGAREVGIEYEGDFRYGGSVQPRIFVRGAAPAAANDASQGFRLNDVWIYAPYQFVAVAHGTGDIDWEDDEAAWMILSDIHAIGSVTAAGALVANANGILSGYRMLESAERTEDGRYTLTFPSQPGNSANYVAQSTLHDSQSDGEDDITAISDLAATSIRVHVYNGVGASVNDGFFITVYRAR